MYILVQMKFLRTLAITEAIWGLLKLSMQNKGGSREHCLEKKEADFMGIPILQRNAFCTKILTSTEVK